MVSVIIPTYNRGHLLVKSIESVLMQTYSAFELIIIDDCSTDNTREVIQRISDQRIRYIRNAANVGAAVSRNIGIKLANYAFIAFQDSDDFWYPDKLEKQLNYFAEHSELGMVYCRYMCHKGNHQFMIPSASIPKENLEGNIFLSLLEGNTVGTPTMLIRKECIEEVGYFDENIKALEDWELALRIAQKKSIGFISDCLLSTYDSEQGVNSNNKNSLDAQIYIFQKYYQEEKYREHLWESILYFLENMLLSSSTTQQQEYRTKIVPTIIERVSDYNLLLASIHKTLKFKENYNLLISIMKNSDLAGRLRQICEANQWDKIAIYGCGNIGKILLQYFKKAQVEVTYMIDKSDVTMEAIEVRKLESIDSIPNAIIVTVVQNYGALIEQIQTYSNADICYIGNLLKM